MRYIVTLICVLFLNQPVQGKLRTFVLGGEERSWEKGGYAPGQLQRKVLPGHRNSTAVIAVDDWNGAAPVALA